MSVIDEMNRLVNLSVREYELFQIYDSLKTKESRANHKPFIVKPRFTAKQKYEVKYTPKRPEMEGRNES